MGVNGDGIGNGGGGGGGFRIAGPLGHEAYDWNSGTPRTRSARRLPGSAGIRRRKTMHHEEPIKLIGDISNLSDGDIRDCNVSRYAMFFLTDQKARLVERGPRIGKYPVLYINGMQGSPAKFRAQACAVAALSGGLVHGVYNAPGTSFLIDQAIQQAKSAVPDFVSDAAKAVANKLPDWMTGIGNKVSGALDGLTDLVECATDKLQSTDLDQFKAWAKHKLGHSQESIEREMVENLTKYNRAAGAMLKQLLQPGYEEARIVAHSQGNIITCNAVNAVAAVRGPSAIAKMKVYAIASPVLFWSEAGQFGQDIVTPVGFTNDAVAWLGMNVDDGFFLTFKSPHARSGETWDGSEISESYDKTLNPMQFLTHNFYAYLEAMWKGMRDSFE